MLARSHAHMTSFIPVNNRLAKTKKQKAFFPFSSRQTLFQVLTSLHFHFITFHFLNFVKFIFGLSEGKIIKTLLYRELLPFFGRIDQLSFLSFLLLTWNQKNKTRINFRLAFRGHNGISKAEAKTGIPQMDINFLFWVYFNRFISFPRNGSSCGKSRRSFSIRCDILQSVNLLCSVIHYDTKYQITILLLSSLLTVSEIIVYLHNLHLGIHNRRNPL